MIEIVKRAAQSRWAPAVVAGMLSLAAAGGAQAASVASLQRNYDEATGLIQPYLPENAAQRQYISNNLPDGGCLRTSMARRYNRC